MPGFSEGPARHPGALAIRAFFPAVVGLLAVSCVVAASVGSTDISWSATLRTIAGKILPAGWVDLAGVSEADATIVWLIRLPRVVVAALVGGALAVAGAQMQGVFRNPLADPNVIGVSQGAALGAVVAFVTTLAARSSFWIPLFGFVGAFAALLTVYAIASRAGSTPLARLLLTGIALGALLSAVTSLLISLNAVHWETASEIVFWMMGGLDSRTWNHVLVSAPFVVFGTAVAMWHARELDLLLLGEEAAAGLGVEIERVKRVLMASAALLTGVAVAVSGVIGFVGLVVPHMVRLVLGPAHRSLLPASLLTGACFLVLCDLLARTVHPPTEIRLGIVTASFGAPFFLYLLRKRRKEIGPL